jgi:hypothetical protein
LRYFEKRDQTKEALLWTPNASINLAKHVITLCKEVREIIRREPRCLKLSSPCYVLGDIHGNYQDLVCFEKSLWRATPLLSPASFLFLGDYVDRGIHGLEVRHQGLLAQCSSTVVHLGDHLSPRSQISVSEKSHSSSRQSRNTKNSADVQLSQVCTIDMTIVASETGALCRECLVKFGEAIGKEIWEAINSVFDVLPLAAVIDEKVNRIDHRS